MKTNASFARLASCVAVLLVTNLSAQESAPTPAASVAPQRARDRDPSWLMDKVEGPNLHYRTFDSKAAGSKVSYLIYLPPGYGHDEKRRYPVVYWLHGIGGSQQGVPEMARRMNQAIEAGKMPPVIFVYCNGMIRSGWSDAQWPVETVTIKELIPYIDANYRTIATREGRGVEGFSMGGGGASVWGFKYTDLFGTVSIIAGAMRNPHAPAPAARGPRANPWELVEKNVHAIRGRTHVRIAVGEKDNLKNTNTSLHEFLVKHDIEHEFDVVPDAAHSPNPVYQGLGDRNWAFYQKAFGQAR